ncbi:MAG TPA: pilus assembly PilX N-terminal domain-containing protein [Pseudobacteroides sp.]|uniref:pilus assembly PilX family protein n=1 Tax=Pseudobacteroides sp. TaxID=1968840 RepID=UPI002F94447C
MAYRLLRSMKKNKNRGSALVLVLLMFIIMSLLGVSLVMATMNGFKMSIFHSDVNRAFYTSESAVEQVASVLNSKVALLQEQARAEASSYIQDLLQTDPEKLRTIDGNIKRPDTENEFRTKYLSEFYYNLDSEFGSIDTEYMKTLLNTATTDPQGKAYKDLGPEHGSMYLESVFYDNSSHTIKVITKGVFNDYVKRLQVVFNLLPDPSSIPYQGVGKVSINKERIRPGIFNKALVAEKNIFTVSGNVNVTGNVLSFGSIPVDAGGEEDVAADGNRYGGIIAGMSTDVAQYDNELGFDAAKTGAVSKGSITINGSAATLGYIQSIYGDDTTAQSSDITINGETFARSVRLDEKSNYSRINLNGNVYITDNLQIDSNESEVNISGEYYGFVDAAYMVDGSGDVSESFAYGSKYKRSSSITVNGDSILNIKNKLFLGGSTFFKNALDTNGNPFMTGISALKSGRRIGNAFMENDEETGQANPLYWFENGIYSTGTPYFSSYNMGGTSVKLMAGRSLNGEQIPFSSITSRGMHFKGIWDNLWKNDEVRSSYIDTQNINITDNGINGSSLIGYSNGAIVANGQVYGINDYIGGHDPTEFHVIQEQCITKFHNAVKDFIAGDLSLDAPKLDYVSPTRNLESYKGDTGKYTGLHKIMANEPYIIKDSNGIDKGMFYYGDRDTDLSTSGSNCIIGGKETVPKGIIYVDGNIYIEDGFAFQGSIIASGNIIFLGNSNISYNASLINELFNNDLNLNGFFNLLEYEVPDETILSQRVEKRNISIIDWQEKNEGR